MLKIKQSQVMISLIDGIGAAAMYVVLVKLTSCVLLGYLGAALMFGSAACVLIINQDNGHTNRNGYWNMGLFILSLVLVGFATNWLVPLVLLVVAASVGLRYLSNTIGPNTKH